MTEFPFEFQHKALVLMYGRIQHFTSSAACVGATLLSQAKVFSVNKRTG